MHRNYCFTLNNYTEEEVEDIKSWKYQYLIIGREIGEQGTPHLQGYIEFSSGVRFSSLLGRNSRIHWEIRKGSQTQAVDYCRKEGQFEEYGEMKCQGRRTDLDAFRQNVLECGMRWATAVGRLQQIQVAEKFLTYHEEPRDWKPEVTWIWGPTGTGKSKRARELLGEDVYTKSDGSKWWPGYDGHEDVIIDDFRDSWWSITEMLSLLDRYEKRIEFKGGYRQLRAKRIVITSCQEPRRCYMGTGESIDQLLRRIDKIEYLGPVTDVTEVAEG